MLTSWKSRWWWSVCAAPILVFALAVLPWDAPAPAWAQADPPAGDQDEAGPSADAAPTGGADAEIVEADEEEKGSRSDAGGEKYFLITLIWKAGLLMIPIYLMSFVVATFGIERIIGLRRRKVMPQELIESLSQLAGSGGGFDPRKAYRLCQRYPSAAATVIRAMLLKVGRPHSEVEHAVSEASEREASRLYANVRWLTMAAAVAPLMGLFGTVWGMILAFHNTTQLEAGQNKADFLAEGIYIALVTTLGGLAVAIPAAILAHFLEGRIQALFHQIDELLFSLLPQIERYEGRLRVSHQSLGGETQPDGEKPIGAELAGDTATAAAPK